VSIVAIALASCLAAQVDLAGSSTTAYARPLDVDAAMDAAESTRMEALARSAYEFCVDEDYEPPPFVDAERFCKTYDEQSHAACPQVAALCAPKKSSSWFDFDLGRFSGIDFRPLLSLILIMAVLAVLVLLILKLRIPKWADSESFGAELDELSAGPIQQLPRAPAMMILDRASAAVTGGSPEQAAKLLQLALLRYFDDTGLAPFHPSRTNNDYLRRVRKHPALADVYRVAAHETDRVEFGGGVANGEVITEAIDTASALVRRVAPPRATTTTAIVAALVVSISGCGGCGDSSKPFYSHAPDGLAAFPALLRGAGIDVDIMHGAFEEVPDDVGVVILASSAAGLRGWSEQSIDPLLDRGIALVVIDDAMVAPAFLPVATTSTNTGVPPSPVELVPTDEILCQIDLPMIKDLLPAGGIRVPMGFALTPKDQAGSLSFFDQSLVPILIEDTGRVAAYASARITKEDLELPGCLFLFGDRHLFTNASMTRRTNAAFVVAFVASLLVEGERVAIWDRIDPADAQENVARSIGEARLLPLIGHAGVFVLALFLMLGAAFGPLRDPKVVRHKAFVEHVVAVGRHWAASGLDGRRYASRVLARRVVAQHRHRGRQTSWAAIAKDLAEKHGLEEHDVRGALRLGLDVGTDLGPPGVGDALPGSERMLRTLSILNARRRRDGR